MNRARRPIALGVVAALLGAAGAGGGAYAETSSQEAFEATAKVVNDGPPALIEVSIEAMLPLAKLTVTSPRGTATLQSCDLYAVAARETRNCRLLLSAPASEKYLTLRVLAQLPAAPGDSRETPRLEQQSFTFVNTAFDSRVRPNATTSRLQAQ